MHPLSLPLTQCPNPRTPNPPNPKPQTLITELQQVGFLEVDRKEGFSPAIEEAMKSKETKLVAVVREALRSRFLANLSLDTATVCDLDMEAYPRGGSAGMGVGRGGEAPTPRLAVWSVLADWLR